MALSSYEQNKGKVRKLWEENKSESQEINNLDRLQTFNNISQNYSFDTNLIILQNQRVNWETDSYEIDYRFAFKKIVNLTNIDESMLPFLKPNIYFTSSDNTILDFYKYYSSFYFVKLTETSYDLVIKVFAINYPAPIQDIFLNINLIVYNSKGL